MFHPKYGLKALEIENLFKKQGECVILDNINLSLEVGEFIGVLGPAGAGKTTLVNILTTREKQDEGEFRLLGVEPRGKNRSVYQRIGVFIEDDSLIPFLTVWQNLWLFSLLQRLPYRVRKTRITNYLHLAGIWELRQRTVGFLSRKEKGLVNAVRVIINEPSLLILDEPERELDSQGMNFLLQQINRLREKENAAVLWLSTKGECFEQADRVAILKKGRIIACDTPFNLKKLISRETLGSQSHSLQVMTLEKVFLSLFGDRNG